MLKAVIFMWNLIVKSGIKYCALLQLQSLWCFNIATKSKVVLAQWYHVPVWCKDPWPLRNFANSCSTAITPMYKRRRHELQDSSHPDHSIQSIMQIFVSRKKNKITQTYISGWFSSGCLQFFRSCSCPPIFVCARWGSRWALYPSRGACCFHYLHHLHDIMCSAWFFSTVGCLWCQNPTFYNY